MLLLVCSWAVTRIIVCLWIVFTFNRVHGVLFKEKLFVRISISSNNGKIFTLQKKMLELWLVHSPESHVVVCLNSYRFCLFHANIYFH